MTSKEIAKRSAGPQEIWLKEIAYQLAVMNERAEKNGDCPAKPENADEPPPDIDPGG
jgi:hypothetical protein